MTSFNQTVIKSPIDTNNYDTFTIQKNGLHVLTIQDYETENVCIVMMVKIGYYHDPIPGMAHFLEHMLFNGTEKYPDEHYFHSFVNRNGGYSNAFTNGDHTVYYLTVQPEKLAESLDIFAQFFIKPLLKKDSVDREKNAVDAEHQKNKFSDAWRLNHIVKNVVNPNHCFKKFGTGCNETLDVDNIHVLVKDFFEKYYSSDLMYLFVASKESNETMRQLIEPIYSNIPNKNLKHEKIVTQGPIFNTPCVIKMVPIADVDIMIISWSLTNYDNDFQNSPLNLISHIIGHEGKKTITQILIDKNYIFELSTGVSEHISNKCIFTIKIRLTSLGFKHKKEIICLILQYIQMMLSRINDVLLGNISDEIVNLAKFNFQYHKKNDVLEEILLICSHLISYEIDLPNIFNFRTLVQKFDGIIKINFFRTLTEMSLDNAVIILCSKRYDGKTNQMDNYYGTHFICSDKHIETIETIKSKDIVNQIDIDLPTLNPYICEDTRLIVTQSVEKPMKIETQSEVDVFIHPSTKFNIPIANIILNIRMSHLVDNEKIYFGTELYINSILKEINTEIYLWKMADFKINVYIDIGSRSLCIQIDGCSDKIDRVFRFFVDAILSGIISDDHFESEKYLMINGAENMSHCPPYEKVGYKFLKKNMKGFYDCSDLLNIIKCIDKNESIVAFRKSLSQTHVTLHLTGNINDSMISEITSLSKRFVENKISINNPKLFDIMIEPEIGENIYSEMVENDYEHNTAFGMFVFLDKIKIGVNNWNRMICLRQILSSIIGNKYFDTLRTKESFGYIVKGHPQNHGNNKCQALYYNFLTQSPHKKSSEIKDRTIKFLVEFRNHLENMSNEEFNEIIKGCISSLEHPFKNIGSMAEYFNFQIMSEYYAYDFNLVLISTYKTLTKNDLIEFYIDKFLENRKSNIIILDGIVKN